MKISIPAVLPESVEALVFDLGGVVLDIDIERSLAALSRLSAVTIDVQDIVAGKASVFCDLELGLLDWAGFIRAFRSEYPAAGAVSDASIRDAWNAMLLPFDERRVALIRELGRYCPVYLLSNTNLPHRVYFRELFGKQFGGRFDDLFVRCFYSDELHLRKPDPEIYRHVAREIGLSAGKLLFIDDNQANVSAARSQGWQAYYLSCGERITDLFEL